MAAPLNAVVKGLRSRTGLLIERYAALQQQNKELREEIDRLRYDLTQLNRDIERLREENQFPILSHRLADSPQAVADARQLVAAMIRDIDRCISRIKE